MPDRIVSHADLLEMVENGAILRRDNKPIVIAGFDDLIAVLNEIAKGNELRAQADLKRYQSTLEILATLQAEIKKSNTPKVY